MSDWPWTHIVAWWGIVVILIAAIWSVARNINNYEHDDYDEEDRGHGPGKAFD